MENSKGSSRFTWEGCSVLLDINDGERIVFARLNIGATLKIGKKQCSLQPIIGCPFGSLFQLGNAKDGPYLSRVLSIEEEGGNNAQEEENVTSEELKDNRALVDNNTAQSLTGEDIDEMRRFLRSDSLSLLLSMANVTAFSDVLVVDMVGGIVTGAVAERLGGTGYDLLAYYFYWQASESTNKVDALEEDLSMEENKSSVDVDGTNNKAWDSSTCKSAKAGEMASANLIDSWKENGFSRYI